MSLEEINKELSFSHLIKKNNLNQYTLVVRVFGMHCASCMRMIENALYGDARVTYARVNLTSEKLTFSWEGDPEHCNALLQLVVDLGFKVKEFKSSSNLEDFKNRKNMLLKALAVSGFAIGNIMLISIILWTTSTKEMGYATQSLFHWISAFISLPTIIYSGRPFFISAFRALKKWNSNMDIPISLALLLTSFMSLLETINHGEYVYFDSAVMLLFFLLVGRYLDVCARGKAKETAEKLLSMLEGVATVIEDGKQKLVPIRDLYENMVVLVASGENIPADGIVIKGSSEIDVSLITGETLPEKVKKGSKVFAGTVNISSPIQFKVLKSSDKSILSNIISIMDNCQQSQAQYVSMADTVAKFYTPFVHTISGITFLGWYFLQNLDWQASLLNSVTVLIITCPCALGLAVPIVQVLTSSWLMKKGILIKSGNALEKMASIDTIIFDKTGTLTLGKPILQGDYEEEDLRLAASLAVHSKHPLSKAISENYKGELFNLTIKELPGKGLEAVFEGCKVKLGSRSFCGNKNAKKEKFFLELWLHKEGSKKVLFKFTDQLRVDSKEVIKKLKHLNIKILLLSGDRKEVVENIAKELEILEYYDSLLPVDKFNKVEELKKEGHKVLMIGDGLNDAPSISAADVSISPCTAVDITQNEADIIFQSENLSSILDIYNMSLYSNILVKQNFVLAFTYNFIAVPFAVMGYVTPLLAAIAMSTSSLLVIINAFRINLKK